MGESYPRRDQARGLWKINDITKNIKEDGTYPQLGGAGRGFAAGNNDSPNIEIDVVSIKTTGNSTDFGDLQDSVVQKQGTANATRGLFAGGYNGSARINVIDQVEIATTGNATDFGDLTEVRNQGFQGMVSSAHGGIA